VCNQSNLKSSYAQKIAPIFGKAQCHCIHSVTHGEGFSTDGLLDLNTRWLGDIPQVVMPLLTGQCFGPGLKRKSGIDGALTSPVSSQRRRKLWHGNGTSLHSRSNLPRVTLDTVPPTPPPTGLPKSLFTFQPNSGFFLDSYDSHLVHSFWFVSCWWYLELRVIPQWLPLRASV
jgi:hypothetical protein